MGELETINIEVTSFCPVGCEICFQKMFHSEYMTSDFFGKTIDEARTMGVKRVQLSGGEPLGHPEIIAFIKAIKERDMEAVMATSGYGLDIEMAQALKASGLDMCQVSLCASYEELNQKYRNGYEQAITAMKNLSQSGQVFRINWIALWDAIDDLDAMIKLAKASGAEGIDVLSQKPTGEEIMERPLNEERLVKLIEVVTPHLSEAYITLESCFDSLRLISRSYSKASKGCIAGRYFVAVKANGHYQPCAHLHKYEETAAGLKSYWMESKVLHDFRIGRNLQKKCRICGHRRDCQPCRLEINCQMFMEKEQESKLKYASILGIGRAK